jgi:hypothetical protein
MYDSFLVRQDSLQNVVKDGEVVGFKFAVQLANYRGIYLSLVNGFYVNMDGVEYDQDDITLEVNGQAPRTMEEISKACWEHWDLQDEGFVNVRKPGGLAKGAHKLGYLPSTMDAYGYQAHDEEWVKNPPQPGKGGGKTYRVCWFDLDLK